MPSRPPTAQGERGENVVVVAVVTIVTVLDVLKCAVQQNMSMCAILGLAKGAIA